ncbi:MAG: hypothetical protein M3N18_04120 [Actinomycetota bacterium]|nr:hypothetical protein [Actinomycetota bacterium]
MYLATDYMHPYRGVIGVRSRCRIRLYLPQEDRDAAVVLCSELSDNPGTPVIDAAEQIAAEVIQHFRLPSPPVWIEHHPQEATNGQGETFELLIFAHYEARGTLRGGMPRQEIGQPTRKQLDRASVEALVGQEV